MEAIIITLHIVQHEVNPDREKLLKAKFVGKAPEKEAKQRTMTFRVVITITCLSTIACLCERRFHKDPTTHILMKKSGDEAVTNSDCLLNTGREVAQLAELGVEVAFKNAALELANH